MFYPRERKFTPKKPIILVVWSIVNDNSQRFKDFYRVATMMINECDFLIVGKPLFDVGKYKNVTFMNSISNLDELAHIYSSADVFFDPSTDDTFGKVVAEALACGTRVVVYNSKALPELVGPGCGEIVEPGDYDSCCEAIRRCILAGKNKDNYCREWII